MCWLLTVNRLFWDVIWAENIVARMCGDCIRRVLDLQLDLLDHTQLHTITVYTLHNSQQLSLFSCSEDPGSNCCNQLLWRPLPSLVITNFLTNCPVTLNNIDCERTAKKTPPKFPLLLDGCPLLRVYPLLSNGC
jgi:hypothetical protein